MTALFRSLLLSCLMAVAAPLYAGESPRPFVAGSLNEIVAAHAGQPFMLMFWSLDCASCMHDLDAVSAEVRKHPEMSLVMVSTDDADAGERVAGMLQKHGLNRVEAWVFADANAQRLRYEVDKTWYGELPRSYFYDAEHNRIGLSGAITAQHIDAWLAAVKNP